MKTLHHNSNDSTYSRLCEIQELVKREFSQKNIINKVKDNHLQHVRNYAEQILLHKLKINSIIDGINQNTSLTYTLKQDTEDSFRLFEEKIYIEPFIFYLRKHQELAFRLLTSANLDEHKKSLSSFFVNYFYANSFSSSSLENEFLLMLYRTLKHEIHSMLSNTPENFLKTSINYFFFKHFIHRDDVTNYFTNVLAPVIEKIDKLDEKELTFDPARMAMQIQRMKDLKLNPNRRYIKEKHANETGTTIDTESSSHSPESIDKNIKVKKDEFFANYMVDLTVKEVEQAMLNIKCPHIKQHVLNYFGIKENTNQKEIDQKYKNSGFVDGVYGSKNPSELIEVIFQYFSIVVDLIEYIYSKLIDTDTIPTFIKYICKMIAILVEEKFPGIDKIVRNAYVSQFFINCLLIPIMNKPELCGLVKSSILIGTTKANIALLSKVIKKFSSGSFFNNVDDPNFTMINRYFIERFEMPQQFFDTLLNVEFPHFLQDAIDNKIQFDVYVYDYFKENPTEYIRDKSFCINCDLILNIIGIVEKNKDEFVKYKDNSEEYQMFVGGIKRLCNHKDKILKEKEKNGKLFPNEKFYFSMQEIEFADNIKYLIKFENGLTFLKDKSNKANVNKSKQSLYEILLNLQNLNMHPIFEQEIQTFSDFINVLKSISQLSFFSLDSSVNNEWFINSFDTIMKHLPLDYRVNDYKNFFEEMKSDLQSSINNLKYCDLKYLINGTRYAEKNLNHFKKTAEKLKKYGFTQNIRKFMSEKKIECSIIIEQTEGKDTKLKRKIFIKPKDNLLNLKLKYLDDYLCEKKQNSDMEISKISDLVKQFPSFKHITPDEKLAYEEEFSVADALNSYYDLFLYTYYSNTESIQKVIPKKKKGKHNDTNELVKQTIQLIQHEEKYQEIRTQISTYLMNKLFNHLFPLEGDTSDLKIFINCQRLVWIQFNDLIDYEDYTLDNLSSVVHDKIKRLDDYRCPNAKLKLLYESRNAIINSLHLLNKEADSQKLIFRYFIYLIIGIAPRKLHSNFKYIMLYADFTCNKIDKGIFEKEMNDVIEYISDPQESLLTKKMTKDEFYKLCSDAESEINLSKSSDLSSFHNMSLSKRSE